MVCRRCQRSAREGETGEALGRSECNGSTAGRTLFSLTGNKNYLWSEHASTQREMARKGGRLVQTSAVPWGIVDESRLHELTRVAGGMESLRAGLGFEAAQAVVAREGESAANEQEEGLGGLREGEAVAVHATEEGQARVQPQPNLEAAGGHVLRVIGPVVFCVKCASHARLRLGIGLKGVCPQPQDKARNATAARLRRLHQGKHPITGKPFTD